jgi:hypothetical protein
MPRAREVTVADTDDDGFIGMPPGIFDSGTFKLPPKTERPRVEREEIVFVPTVPGMPLPIEPEPAPEPESAPERTSASDPEPVSHETRRALPDPYDAPLVAEHPPAGPAEPAPVTAPTPVPRWLIQLPEGGETAVGSVLLVGRNPAAFDAYPGAELLSVDDSTQSVSKTHAAFEVDEQGLWVHDLNSTNGVWVVRGDEVTEAVPGRRVQVHEGSSVELGDYVLTVARR